MSVQQLDDDVIDLRRRFVRLQDLDEEETAANPAWQDLLAAIAMASVLVLVTFLL